MMIIRIILRLYGHVERLPVEDPAHRIISCRDPRRWIMRQVEFYLKDTGMRGLAFAWAMARRRTREYRHNVNAATRCSGVCYHN